MSKQLPLTKLKGCGKLFYQPRYAVRWQFGKSRKELETFQLLDSEVCGVLHAKRVGRVYHRRYVILCETCIKQNGISW